MHSKVYWSLFVVALASVLSARVEAACQCDPRDSACLQNCVNNGQRCIADCAGNNNCYRACIQEHWPGQEPTAASTTEPAASTLISIPAVTTTTRTTVTPTSSAAVGSSTLASSSSPSPIATNVAPSSVAVVSTAAPSSAVPTTAAQSSASVMSSVQSSVASAQSSVASMSSSAMSSLSMASASVQSSIAAASSSAVATPTPPPADQTSGATASFQPMTYMTAGILIAITFVRQALSMS
ncbi:hypothetical protein BDF20DRAFT_23132 [Mycotypha africana]|uniref:uncharacterized protein n=1 Tax=Mycotypha africana TaxID=64632 RepID=UPI0023018A82|nr:uncharacterized protein BDF20DRAFT_23132 [Mycotypha africana]KAI8991120.1 hypothetical protein BDF20DRAFT_23132 [Mycotypha africana]